MKIKDIITNKYVKGSMLVLAGLLLGWLIFHDQGHDENANEAEHDYVVSVETIWTCAMHPQIRMKEKGLCPICGMELIPLQESGAEIDNLAIVMSESAMKLAEVQTMIVGAANISKEITLFGKIQPDERSLQSQAAHVPGRIETLLVNVTGESVRRGQLIAKIYSPELITAQKELLEAAALADRYPEMVNAVKEKLRNWKLTDSQISQIEKTGEIISSFEIYANTSGIVMSRIVNEGDYVSTGTVLFTVADLSRVWALFDAYESDLSWISIGNKITFTTRAIPAKTFESKVTFIEPVVDPQTRVTRIRAEVANPGLKMKPEMFVNGTLKATSASHGNELVIPQSAVLWTGTRSIVYVKLPSSAEPAFRMREIVLGAAMDNAYEVKEGLEAGEEIAVNGTFSIDAAAQLAGKPSMMNTTAGKPMAGHQHGQIEDGSVTGVMVEVRKIELSSTAKDAIHPIIGNYLLLKDALVNDDFEAARSEAKQLKSEIGKVKMDLFQEDAHNVWMHHGVMASENLDQIVKAENIGAARAAFKPFSEHMIRLVKMFNSYDKKLYIQHCPMADDFKGADWLSTEKEIKNPYYGESMLTCGEIKEEISNN